MTISASQFAGLIDVDPTTVLRDMANGAKTVTGIEMPIALSVLDGAYWDDRKDVPHGAIEIMVSVASCKGSDGDETYVIEVLADDSTSMNNNPVAVWSGPIPRGYRGSFKIVVDSAAITKLDPDFTGSDRYLALRTTLGGTEPSIIYGANIVKSI